jgi:hypothetical protein
MTLTLAAGLDSQNSGTRIVGTADNLSTVLYMREVCNVQRSTLLFSPAAGLFGNSIFGKSFWLTLLGQFFVHCMV